MTPKKTPKRLCKCIDKVEKLLAKQGAQLDLTFGIPGFTPYVIISTSRRDPRSRVKLKTLVASFCPFCGKKYPERQRAEPKKKAA